MDRKFWLSLGATLLPLPVILLGTHVLLPGVDLAELGPSALLRIDPSSPPLGLSLFALGLTPAIFAFLLVELAAFAFPAYRPLRHTREGRWKLRRAAHFATLPIALFFAATTAQGYLPFLHGGVSLVLLLSGLLGGSFLLLVLAEFVERRGLASGFVAVLVASALISILDLFSSRPTSSLLFAETPDPRAPFVMIGVTLVVAAATIFVLRRPITVVPGASHDPDGEPAIVLRAPLSGVVPFGAGLFVASVLRGFAPGAGTYDAQSFLMSTEGTLVVGVASAIVLAYLFQPPSRVQRLWQHALRPIMKKKRPAPDDPGDAPEPQIQAPRDVYAPPAVDAPPGAPLPVPFVQALIATLAYLGALFLCAIAIRRVVGAGFSIVSLVLLAGFALDAYETARFVAQHGPCVTVRAEVRAYTADLAVRLLARRKIPVHVRSRHTGTLLQLTPFAPMYILVPEAHVKAATKTLDRALGPLGSPKGQGS